MKKCFYMFSHGIDFIMETEHKNITDKIAIEFLNKIQNHFNRFYNISDEDITLVKRHILPGYYEIKSLNSGIFAGREYVNIHTKNGCFGCDPCDDIKKYTVIWRG